MKRPEPKGFVSVSKEYFDGDTIIIEIRGGKSIELRKLVAQYIDLVTSEFFIDGVRLHSRVAFSQPTYPVSTTSSICNLYNTDDVVEYMLYLTDRINYATCGKENDAIENIKALITNYQQN